MINTTAQNALKNSVYNFIGFILPIIVMIFITPIIISKWGVKDYGIYIFLSTITLFLGLLDLGVSVATSKHIIEYYSNHDENKLKKLIYSMNSIYLIMSIIFFLVCVAIGFIIQIFFIERVGLGNNNFPLIFFILGSTVFIGTIFSNFGNILVTMQRYDLQLKISMFLILLSNIGMLILVLLGYGLIPVLLFNLFVMLLSNIIYFISARKVFPIMQLKYAWKTEEILKNYKFGISVAFNNLANSSLVHFDKLLIPIFLGNAQLTYYSVPGSIATKISNISSVFATVLFPITVNLQSLNKLEKIKRVYIRSLRLITILAASISFSIIFVSDKILLYWLGENFSKQSTIVLILLILTNFFLALFSPISNLLMAMGKMKFLTMGSIIMMIINIVALFLLLPKYGINGAAVAYLIATVFVYYMLYYAEKNYFKINHIKENIKLLIKILTVAVPHFFIVKFLIYPLITNLITLIIFGPIIFGIFLIIYKIFGFVEKEDWDDFKTMVLKFLTKFKLKKITN